MAMKECPSGFRPCVRCHSGKSNFHGYDQARAREFRPARGAEKPIGSRRTRVRMKGTGTTKLRARVEIEGGPRFAVTIGSKKWESMWMTDELRALILERAKRYLQGLTNNLEEAILREEAS